MLRKFVLLLLFAALVTGSVFAAGGKVTWTNDFEAAKKEAAETGKPILLAFGGDW
jgi:hypothetical protein